MGLLLAVGNENGFFVRLDWIRNNKLIAEIDVRNADARNGDLGSAAQGRGCDLFLLSRSAK